MSYPLRKSGGERNAEESNGTLFGRCSQLYRSGSTNYRRDDSIHIREFTVSDIKRVNYSELFPSDDEADDIWFKCKLSFITLDEKSGAEKRTFTNVLVQASDLGRAKKNLDAEMKGTMAEYQVSSVTETAIMDVYPYTAPEEESEFKDEKAN